VLKDIAAACGLDAARLEARWADESEVRRVGELEEEMKKLGISGVPTYIIDRKFAVSGAQPPQMLATAIREAAADAGG